MRSSMKMLVEGFFDEFNQLKAPGWRRTREMLLATRSHWAIENSLHWVLDMIFSEDQP